MWYISYHGGSVGVNNIQVFHKSGKPHKNPNLLPVGGDNPSLYELRGFCVKDDLLYVVNAYKKNSLILTYESGDEKGYTFKDTYASQNSVEGVFHPYDITFDDQGNGYISSQDSNLVTGLSGPNCPMPIAPFLKNNFSGPGPFLAGTRVASSKGELPHSPIPNPPNVPTPQGLDVNYTDDTDSRIAHSVRGILSYKGYLFVSDEPANAIKIFDTLSGKLFGQIKNEDILSSPVQLLEREGILYIGSSGNKSVVCYNLNQGIPNEVVSPYTFIDGKVKHISGMAFDDEGYFYAAERKAKKIKKFQPDGKGDGETFIKDLPDNPEFILFVPKV